MVNIKYKTRGGKTIKSKSRGGKTIKSKSRGGKTRKSKSKSRGGKTHKSKSRSAKIRKSKSKSRFGNHTSPTRSTRPWSVRCKDMKDTCKSTPTTLIGDDWCDVPEWDVFHDSTSGSCIQKTDVEAMFLASDDKIKHPISRRFFTPAEVADVFETLGRQGKLKTMTDSKYNNLIAHYGQQVADIYKKYTANAASYKHIDHIVVRFREDVETAIKHRVMRVTFHKRALVSELVRMPYVKHLVVKDLELTKLPTLPPTLVTLDCSFNRLAELPMLPPTLAELNCGRNFSIRKLPTLPSTLVKLECQSNSILVLPTLPPTLENLYCSNNSLTRLPELPLTLVKLIYAGNSITRLPDLPPTLKFLDCRYNKITQLPALPPGLTSSNVLV